MRAIAFALIGVAVLIAAFGLNTVVGATTGAHQGRDVMSFSEAILGTGEILFAGIIAALAVVLMLADIGEQSRVAPMPRTVAPLIDSSEPTNQEDAEREVARLMQRRER